MKPHNGPWTSGPWMDVEQVKETNTMGDSESGEIRVRYTQNEWYCHN